MRCHGKDCDDEPEWVQLTIDGEEHYCNACMAALGGTYAEPSCAPEPAAP